MKRLCTLGRLFSFAVLTAMGIGKALDVAGFAQIIDTYQVVPESLLFFAAFAIIGTELALAAWLASGLRLDRSALAAALLHAVFIGWMLLALGRGLVVDRCGCFGVLYARPLTYETVAGYLVPFAVALMTSTLARRQRKNRRGFTLAID